MQSKTYVHNIIIIIISFCLCLQRFVIELFQLFPCTLYITKTFLQNWGDYAGMSQAVAVYVAFFSHVLLICWFGTQLTQHVRENTLFLLVTLFKKIRS